MMDKKLYFSDPLAAAYMAVEYGVEFENELRVSYYIEPRCEDTLNIGYTGGNNCLSYSEPPFYVQPKSHPIFTIQHGDHYEINGSIQLYDASNSLFRVNKDGSKKLIEPGSIDLNIVYRDDKPFFMPKEETP